LSLFSKASVKIIDHLSKPGISQTTYLPKNDVIQTADGNTFSDAIRTPNLPEKTWLVTRLEVFSVNGKTFCYVLRGNLVEVQDGAIVGRLAESIVLNYSDQDGDGSLETFRYTIDEAPSIPKWVRRNG